MVKLGLARETLAPNWDVLNLLLAPDLDTVKVDFWRGLVEVEVVAAL